MTDKSLEGLDWGEMKMDRIEVYKRAVKDHSRTIVAGGVCYPDFQAAAQELGYPYALACKIALEMRQAMFDDLLKS